MMMMITNFYFLLLLKKRGVYLIYYYYYSFLFWSSVCIMYYVFWWMVPVFGFLSWPGIFTHWHWWYWDRNIYMFVSCFVFIINVIIMDNVICLYCLIWESVLGFFLETLMKTQEVDKYSCLFMKKMLYLRVSRVSSTYWCFLWACNSEEEEEKPFATSNTGQSLKLWFMDMRYRMNDSHEYDGRQSALRY